MPFGEKIRDDIWSTHAKLHEFCMHRDSDMNLSSFSFYEFCTLEELELGRIAYMKDIVPDEEIRTKLNSYFSNMYFSFYEFSNFMNRQI
jgi:hypothetical protein